MKKYMKSLKGEEPNTDYDLNLWVLSPVKINSKYFCVFTQKFLTFTAGFSGLRSRRPFFMSSTDYFRAFLINRSKKTLLRAGAEAQKTGYRYWQLLHSHILHSLNHRNRNAVYRIRINLQTYSFNPHLEMVLQVIFPEHRGTVLLCSPAQKDRPPCVPRRDQQLPG